MSRFANPEATERYVLGPCECPGNPHDDDWIDLRTELGAEDALALVRGTGIDALLVMAVRWNLLEDDGTAAPVDGEHISRLFADNLTKLNAWTKLHVRFNTLPNASAARSQRSTRTSGSRTPRLTKVG